LKWTQGFTILTEKPLTLNELLITKMTLSLNCKDAGDPVCTHTMYGETEEELLQNAKKHGMEVHGYTEQSWNEVTKNTEHFRKIIKKNG
jgi:predicted small metal-binding protein